MRTSSLLYLTAALLLNSTPLALAANPQPTDRTSPPPLSHPSHTNPPRPPSVRHPQILLHPQAPPPKHLRRAHRHHLRRPPLLPPMPRLKPRLRGRGLRRDGRLEELPDGDQRERVCGREAVGDVSVGGQYGGGGWGHGGGLE